MPRQNQPHLERRPSGYYFRRRLPHLPPSAGSTEASAKSPPEAGARKNLRAPPQTGSVCLSLRTHFLRDAKILARRLTAASDVLFAARTEQDMPIAADIMGAILGAVRDREIQAHERSRARAPVRSSREVDIALTREAEIQAALRNCIAHGQRDVALPLINDAATALGLALDAEDPDLPILAHNALRLLVEISQERATREAGGYDGASVLAELSSTVGPRPAAPTFHSLRGAEPRVALQDAFGTAVPAQPLATLAVPSVPSPMQLSLSTPTRDFAMRSSSTVSDVPRDSIPTYSPPTVLRLGHLRIDPDILTEDARIWLLDPSNMRIDQAFDIFIQVKTAGYGDMFSKTQKRLPGAGASWVRSSLPGMMVARRFWADLLDNCRLNEVTKAKLQHALDQLWRLPKHHGKTYDNSKGFYDMILATDLNEIEQQVAAAAAIEADPSLSEAQGDELRQKANIPRIRSETYLKHGRAMGRIGRFLEQLGLLPTNPFALCSWTAQEEKQLKSKEETRARVEWDDRLYDLFRTPIFQGVITDPGDPLFWAPLIAVHNGPRLQEILQLGPDDFGYEGGHLYFQIRNLPGNSVKSISSERRLPVHPNLIKLGLVELIELRRRQKEPRLFPNIGRGETRGTQSELFTKAFGYYRQTNGVYWPGLDFHALRTTFHGFLLNSRVVSDARRRRLMGHKPVDEGEVSYAQGLRSSALLEDLLEVQIDISMIQSPFDSRQTNVVSLPALRAKKRNS